MLSWLNLARCQAARHAVVVAAVRRYSEPPPYPHLKPDITFTELRDHLATDDVTLLDVRTTSELNELGFVPGSYNVPLQKLGLLMLLPKEDFHVRMGFPKPISDAPLVVMCKSGTRARTAQLALQGLGYTNVRRYLGSFLEWEELGGKIIKAELEDIDE